MAIPYGICGYLMFANPDVEGAGKLVYAYLTYSAMMLVYTAINVPYSSLMAVLSPSSQARTVASSFRFVGAFGGGLIVSSFARPLVQYLGDGSEIRGYQMTMALFAILSIALFWITFATTNERVKPPVGQTHNAKEELGELFRNRPWIMLFVAAVFSTTFLVTRSSVTIHYFKYVAGADETPIFWIFDRATVFLSLGMFMMMLEAMCIGFVIRYADKKALSVYLTFGTAVCLIAFYFVPPEQYTLLLVLNAIASLLMGPTSALVWAMYGDVADYGEYKYGRRSTGLIHAASLFSLKMGVMIAGALAGWMLDLFGFEANEAQTEPSLYGITLMFSLIPAVFAIGKGVALLIYPLDRKQVEAIETELAQRAR